jgi:hypothetical protein
MGESDPHQRDGPNSSGRYRLWCCFVLLLARSSYAQDIRPASLAGQSLTVAVTADIAQRCGNRITAPFRLFLYRHGIGTVEVSGLLKVLDGMRLELRSLIPVAEASW